MCQDVLKISILKKTQLSNNRITADSHCSLSLQTQTSHPPWLTRDCDYCCSSVALSCPTLCNPMDCSTPAHPVHHQLPELAQTHVHQISDAIQPSSSSVVPFSSRLQSFPASGSFPVSQFFTSCGQSIGSSASVLPVNIQGWFPLGLTGLISLLSKGLLKVFSSTTVQKHQFFGAQPSLWSNSHIHTWLLEEP